MPMERNNISANLNGGIPELACRNIQGLKKEFVYWNNSILTAFVQ